MQKQRMTLKQKDELIAKFLGWFQEDGQKDTWFIIDGFAKYVVYSIHSNHPYLDLPFSRSKDWLFKVIDKIEDLGYNVHISRRSIQVWKFDPKNNWPEATDLIIDEDFLNDYVGDDKYKAIYECAVSFIEYYNNNQK